MQTIEVNKKNYVLEVVLNRPKAHNAMSAEMIQELTEVFQSVDKDPTVRVVKLSGTGPSFCAGADLNWMKESVEFTEQQNLEDAQKLFDMFLAIKNCPVPTVACVHGHVMGGALGLLAVCDIVYSVVGSVYSFSEVKLGLVPAIISPFVKRKLTTSAMHNLMLTAKKFDSDEALRIGLITEKVRELELDKKVEALMQSFSTLAPEAVIETKKLLLSLETISEDAHREHTSSVIAKKRASSEGQEGLRAFFEKRQPNWIVPTEVPGSEESSTT